MRCVAVVRRIRVYFVLALMTWSTVGCVSLPMGRSYKGPAERPDVFERYYAKGRSYTGFLTEFTRKFENYSVYRYVIDSDSGVITVDYFKLSEPSKELVFLYPALGGKNHIENYFADYFATHGLEAAIVHRNNDFKDPENFLRIEEMLRHTVVRDRVAVDFFEQEHGKSEFGTFGISRGAINVASSAGVEPRLKYNVLAMGGTDLIGLFEDSDQPRIRKYLRRVSELQGIPEEEVIKQLRGTVKTDPKYLAGFLDARNTLLILGALDRTVPFRYGKRLRRQIGYPRTIVLLANHYLSLLYTQIVKVFPPDRSLCVFPFDYIESEALAFYNKKFKRDRRWWRLLPLRILKAPVDLTANLISRVAGQKRPEAPKLPIYEIDEGTNTAPYKAREVTPVCPLPDPPPAMPVALQLDPSALERLKNE